MLGGVDRREKWCRLGAERVDFWGGGVVSSRLLGWQCSIVPAVRPTSSPGSSIRRLKHSLFGQT